ncbi:MAG: dTMP kinase [Baekduia sp.]
MSRRGRLITLEGIDGAGKSTLAGGLLAAFPGLQLLREPGGVAASERIRDLVKDPQLRIDPRAEALLFAAARAQLVSERLEPLLASGADVLLDRFTDSSLAYQGAGRELGIDAVAAINAFATGGLTPDLTLYVRVPPAVGAERRAGDDRLEQAGAGFFETITAAFDRLAAEQPERYRTIDGTAAPEQVLADGVRILKLALSGG